MVAIVPSASPTPLLLAQLAGELGAFCGILNVIIGPASLGATLGLCPGVQKVAFCGAVEVPSGLSLGAEGAGPGGSCSAEPCGFLRKHVCCGRAWRARGWS